VRKTAGVGPPHWKLAVTDFGPDMVNVCGFELPVKAPVQLTNVQPEAAAAVSCTPVPAL
jgi:hypothetical protein